MLTLKVYKQIVTLLKVHSVIPHYLRALEVCCFSALYSQHQLRGCAASKELKWEAESLNSLRFPVIPSAGLRFRAA